MEQIGAFDAKNQLSALLDRAEKGEEVVITRHGRPVARLVPSSSGIDRERARAAAERMRERADAQKAGPFHWDEFKRDRDTGRP